MALHPIHTPRTSYDVPGKALPTYLPIGHRMALYPVHIPYPKDVLWRPWQNASHLLAYRTSYGIILNPFRITPRTSSGVHGKALPTYLPIEHRMALHPIPTPRTSYGIHGKVLPTYYPIGHRMALHAIPTPRISCDVPGKPLPTYLPIGHRMAYHPVLIPPTPRMSCDVPGKALPTYLPIGHRMAYHPVLIPPTPRMSCDVPGKALPTYLPIGHRMAYHPVHISIYIASCENSACHVLILVLSKVFSKRVFLVSLNSVLSAFEDRPCF